MHINIGIHLVWPSEVLLFMLLLIIKKWLHHDCYILEVESDNMTHTGLKNTLIYLRQILASNCCSKHCPFSICFSMGRAIYSMCFSWIIFSALFSSFTIAFSNREKKSHFLTARMHQLHLQLKKY